MAEPPDLIHGQHHLETMAALTQFPATPCIYFCHGWLPWEEVAPRHPRIVRYVAVNDLVREHLLYERGIPPQQITTIRNFVDLQRFQPRTPLPPQPQRALVFSNQANEANFVGIVREACARFNIEVDVRGIGSGNPTMEPEAILGDYDLVIARGRAAMEAMAVGAAVICCDLEGLAGLVTPENFDWLYRNNFGLRTLNRPITTESLTEEIARYDAASANLVSTLVRTHCGLTTAVDQIVDLYNDVLRTPLRPDAEQSENNTISSYLSWLSASIPYKGIYEIQAFSERIELLQQQLWLEQTKVAQQHTLLEEARSAQSFEANQTTLTTAPESPVGPNLLKRMLRGSYHLFIPLPLRLRLRNIRVGLIGR
jgi:hypothetical protein